MSSDQETLRERLAAALDECAPDGYLKRMWTYALSPQSASLAAPIAPEAARHGALPYVPFSPEDLGHPLQAESLVLDIGCLGGYGLFDFRRRRAAQHLPIPRLAGIDRDAQSVAVGQRLAAIWADDGQAVFLRACGENLPFGSAVCALALARLLLPYVCVASVLAEIGRALQPGGFALFQIHAPAYYWRRLRVAGSGGLRLSAYYLRPLLSFWCMTCTGRQPQGRWFGETALTDSRLIRLCAANRLRLIWRNADRETPLLLFERME